MPRKQSPPAVPAGLTGTGRSLWMATAANFELEAHELALLREACLTADSIDSLQAAVDRDGVLNTSPQGLRAHPALVELRQQRSCFARLVRQLAIPADEPATGRQKASYGIRGLAQ
jgi:hypothetical protein